MDTTRGETAADFLARADERTLTQVIRDYGEERFAFQIAKALVARRESGHPVRTTGELAALVAGAVKTREPGQDPATRTFQALRIFVNAELEALEQGLNAALALLAPQGRLVVISFHSLRRPHRQDLHRAREPRRARPPRADGAAARAAAGALGARQAVGGRGRRQPARALGRDARGRAHRGGCVNRLNLLLLAALIARPAAGEDLVRVAPAVRRAGPRARRAAGSSRPTTSAWRPSARRRPRPCGWSRWRASKLRHAHAPPR